MKVSLKRRLNLFPKLRRRLSSVKWILLLVTTAMFFLSASSSGCSFNVSFGGPPGTGPNVVGPQSSQPALPPVAGGSPPAVAGGSPPAVAGGSPPAVAGGSPPAVVAPTTPPQGGKSGGPPGGGATAMVTIAQGPPTASDASGFIFKPATLTIKKGTMVTWQNPTKVPHTVTADNGSFDSGNLAAGKSFSFVFSKAGTFAYSCQDHPGQVGTVIVQ